MQERARPARNWPPNELYAQFTIATLFPEKWFEIRPYLAGQNTHLHPIPQSISLDRGLALGLAVSTRKQPFRLLLAKGATYQEIQKLLDTTAPTISRWKARFLRGRVAGLMEEHHPV